MAQNDGRVKETGKAIKSIKYNVSRVFINFRGIV